MPQTAYDLEPFIAEYYDWIPPVARREDLNFYREMARLARGPILELGCGTGRILLPLANEGQRVAGLDLSEHMLAKARERLSHKPAEVQQRVRLVLGDMRDFDLGEKFRLVTIPFRPFQHLLETADQLACLRCAHKHLEPDGKLVLDFFQTDPRRMHDAAFQQESSPFPVVEMPDGRKVRLAERTAAFHRATQRNDVELIYYVTHPDGRAERLIFAFTVRYFFRYEVEHLLERCGFRVADVFGNFQRSPLEDSSPEMIFVAEKA